MVIEFFQTIPDPSYAQGFARSAGEALNPGLWSGQVGAWMPSLGPTGSTLMDISGHGNNGILTNMNPATDWVPGLNGYALHFDGSNEHVQVDSISGAFFAYPYSFCAWARTTGSGFYAILGFGVLAETTQYLVFGINETKAYVTYRDFAQDQRTAGPAINDGKWHHIAFVAISDSVVHLYVDGVSVLTDTFSNGLLFDVADIGALSRGGSRGNTVPFLGDISDVSAYKRALSPSEILQLYQDPMACPRRKGQIVALEEAAPAEGHAGPLVDGPILKSKVGGGLIAA